MIAEKFIVETDASGHLKKLPTLPPNKRIETIFLVLDEAPSKKNKRKPCPDLRDKIEILGDIMSTVTEEKWDLPK